MQDCRRIKPTSTLVHRDTAVFHQKMSKRGAKPSRWMFPVAADLKSDAKYY